MNETTKYGLFFLGGVVLGALGAVAVTRGKLDVKPLATDLLSAGIDLKEKALSAVESAKEDIADAVAFLASDRAAFITGEILPVAGGFGLPTPLYGSYMSAGAKG